MSTKKDKFTKKDIKYMSLALNLARERHGLTGQNPSVGCVIVKNNKIISVGQTGYLGRPHAEYNAIKDSIDKLEGSKVTYIFEPSKSSIQFFIALNSACGLPSLSLIHI